MATILLVDDRPLNREFLVLLLGSAHHHLLEASDGAEALKIAKTQPLDLIITDILMPTMDGIELASQLQTDATLKKIPIIFYTATYRQEDARTLAKKCGVHFVLTKPSESQLILDTVQKALGVPKTEKSKSIPMVEPMSSAIHSGESNNLRQLQSLTSQLVQLAEFNLDLVSETDAPKLLLLFCKGVGKLLRAKYSVLGILNEKEGGLKYFVVSGIEKKIQSSMGIPTHTDQGLIGQILKNKGALKIDDPRRLSQSELLPHHPSISHCLGFPILTKYRLHGFVYFADRMDKVPFTEEDTQIAQTLIAELAALYENIRLYDDLQQHAVKLQLDVLEQKKAQESLSKSELLFRQFAENIKEVFWRTSTKMDKIFYVSPSYEDIWGRSPKSFYENPQEWFESIVPEDRPMVQEIFGKLMKGKVQSISVEFRIMRPDGEIRNIYSRGFHMKDEKGKILLGVASDITEFQKAKERGILQNKILNTIKISKSIKEVTTQMLMDIGNALTLDLGSIWMIDPIEKVLRCIDVWSRDSAKHEPFIKKSFELSFPKGNGLPGLVWQNKKSLWLEDLSKISDFPSASRAMNVGLKSAFAIPISYRNKIYGVIEFFLSHTPKTDPALLDLIEKISNQLGEFIYLKHTEEQLTHIAHHDILTGLMNRSTFEEKITKKIETSPPFVGIIIFDIDRFKLISEEMGHEAGDLLLQAVANKLNKVFSPEKAIAARLGADKFILGLVDLQSIGQIKADLKTIQDLFKDAFLIKGDEVYITGSIGISIYPEDGVDVKKLLRKAEIALNLVKEQGGNHFHFCSSNIQALSSEKMMLESALRRALLENQFCLYYQPKVDLKTGQICGFEALIRWNHPENGLLLPSAFISVAEQSDIIILIGEWVLHEVCRQIANKEIPATEEIPIAVNLSVLQFHARHHLVEYIIKLIKDFEINPSFLELEVTEGILAKDMEESFKLLDTINKMDIRISLDDFGTGYSSLRYIQYFPVNKIKIDKSFIDGLPDNQQSKAIVRAIIALSHSLDKKVIAEGVETAQQLKFLSQEGCDEIQGFYFSKPMPADKIRKMIEEKKHLILGNIC